MCLLCKRDGDTSRHHGRQPKPKPTFAPTERERSTETELAWAAGFFDGEGWTTVSGRYVQIGVTQVEQQPLERFLKAVGWGSISRSRRTAAWRVSGEGAYRVIEALWPYLSDPKREQFLRCERSIAA